MIRGDSVFICKDCEVAILRPEQMNEGTPLSCANCGDGIVFYHAVVTGDAREFELADISKLIAQARQGDNDAQH